MLTNITIDQARNLYPSATHAVQYTSHNATIVTFEVDDLIIQVNTFPDRKEAFSQPREDLIDNLFDFLMEEDNAERLK